MITTRKATPLLTLRKINSSQEEMNHITLMRNIIKFQLEEPEQKYYYFEGSFYQEFVVEKREVDNLHACLSHTFSQIVRSRVPVHNLEPFCHWGTVNIDSLAHTKPPYRGQQTPVDIHDAMEQGDCFLIATFGFLIHYTYRDDTPLLLERRHLFFKVDLRKLEINNPENNSKGRVRRFWRIPESTWRRVYDNNYTLFFYEDKDMNTYIKEQTQGRDLVSVSEQIRRRERGESFNQLAVLRTIASPYYFVLPHQDQDRYAFYEANGNWIQTLDLSHYALLRFHNQLDVGVKNAP
ncbi:uncharacterized protein TNCT_316551 [Trichonephila clavata]|uniref:Uncharacterized protein n=1 Tax=Trichonephila clavata TaxID=2740835 RepID=A0A8X6KSS4_TRICU|nr:uncharacterized protein TNCT_316551 [Trichonephila clavata]